jgi:hypothetical protein
VLLSKLGVVFFGDLFWSRLRQIPTQGNGRNQLFMPDVWHYIMAFKCRSIKEEARPRTRDSEGGTLDCAHKAVYSYLIRRELELRLALGESARRCVAVVLLLFLSFGSREDADRTDFDQFYWRVSSEPRKRIAKAVFPLSGVFRANRSQGLSRPHSAK